MQTGASDLTQAYCAQAAEVQAVLVGHSSPVNCITWLPQPGSPHALQACAFLQHAVLLVRDEVKAKRHAVAALEETGLSDDTHALVSGSADGTVIVWLVTLQQEEQPWSLHSQLQASMQTLESSSHAGDTALQSRVLPA